MSASAAVLRTFTKCLKPGAKHLNSSRSCNIKFLHNHLNSAKAFMLSNVYPLPSELYEVFASLHKYLCAFENARRLGRPEDLKSLANI